MEEKEGFTRKDWLRLIGTVVWLIVFVTWPRLTAGVSLLIAGGVMMAFNAMIFWTKMIRKGDGPAVAPIFGGILAGVGIAILPVDGIWKWAWIPLLLDWGGLPMLLAAWYRHIRNQTT